MSNFTLYKNNATNFYFTEVSEDKIQKEILKLNHKKAFQDSDVPVKILKENSNIFSTFLHNAFNGSIKSSKFPLILKLADIALIHKRGKYLCGFHTGFSAQQCLLVMLEKWSFADVPV